MPGRDDQDERGGGDPDASPVGVPRQAAQAEEEETTPAE